MEPWPAIVAYNWMHKLQMKCRNMGCGMDDGTGQCKRPTADCPCSKLKAHPRIS